MSSTPIAHGDPSNVDEQADDLDHDFFAPVPPAATPEPEDLQFEASPMPLGSKRAMRATVFMVAASLVCFPAFIAYHQLVMPAPAALEGGSPSLPGNAAFQAIANDTPADRVLAATNPEGLTASGGYIAQALGVEAQSAAAPTSLALASSLAPTRSTGVPGAPIPEPQAEGTDVAPHDEGDDQPLTAPQQAQGPQATSVPTIASADRPADNDTAATPTPTPTPTPTLNAVQDSRAEASARGAGEPTPDEGALTMEPAVANDSASTLEHADHAERAELGRRGALAPAVHTDGPEDGADHPEMLDTSSEGVASPLAPTATAALSPLGPSEEREATATLGANDSTGEATPVAEDPTDADADPGARSDANTGSLTAAYELLNSGRFAEAASAANVVTSAAPEKAEAWLVLGAAQDAMGRHDEAQTAYRRCSESLGPHSANCRLLLR